MLPHPDLLAAGPQMARWNAQNGRATSSNSALGIANSGVNGPSVDSSMSANGMMGNQLLPGATSGSSLHTSRPSGSSAAPSARQFAHSILKPSQSVSNGTFNLVGTSSLASRDRLGVLSATGGLAVTSNSSSASAPTNTASSNTSTNRIISTSVASGSGSATNIREVWADNLQDEMALLRAVIDDYPFVAMDTEFPGVVARPIGSFRSGSDYHYQTLRCNVDMLKIIQLGLTVSNARGEVPEVGCWQFNFQFSLKDDMYAPDSIDLLTKSGIDFKKLETYGIEVQTFAELLITSGFVLSDDVRWISFHSGYDFGYLIKLLSALPLPSSESEFFDLLKLWFPGIYDIKYLMKACKTLKGGLQDVADELGVVRVGPQHQAGSDSLVTALAFFRMREQFFENIIEDTKYLNHLYGLGIAASNGHHNFTAIASGSLQNMSPWPLPSTPLNNPVPTSYQTFQPNNPYSRQQAMWNDR